MNKRAIFCICLTGILLSGCGPIYQTQYSFKPPHSKVGMMCAMNCQNARQNCIQIRALTNQNCEYRAEMEYQHCRHRHPNDYLNKCWKRSCFSSDNRCDANFRACYQTCGGKVYAKQICTAFCK